MRRAYEDHLDDFGEPKSIIKPVPEPPVPRPSHHEICAGFEATARRLILADQLYEKLRDEGVSHIEARRKIEEFLKP